ncbi:hypothetical protein COY87_04430, partial [Candidatus Roizmanbacteria bacterium CG_4_10_14_0_8_um_filter_33_9]
MSDEFDTKIPKIHKPKINQLNRQIPPEAHTPMYNWHKFWSRKTWNVVAEFIKTYCPPNGVTFDPFAGSGVAAFEALKHGRRAIVCDILPVSTEIIRLTIKPVSLTRLQEAYKRVEEKVKNKIMSLYMTKCRKCGNEFPLTCAIWIQERSDKNSPIQRKCLEVRYSSCTRCGDRRDKNTPPNTTDLNLIKEIDKREIQGWYPKQKLYHTNGRPFMKKEKYESMDELFTKRNLQALAWLMEAIEQEKNRDLHDFLKIAFTSVVHLCSSLLAEGEPGYRPFSGVGWNQQSYWFTPRFMESNVWEKFESAIFGNQGLVNAKKESNKYFEHVRFASSYDEVIKGDADVFIYNGSCFELMGEMSQKYGEKGCVDYIFTDPPYDASIQYGELAYLWVTWLKKDDGYLEKIASDEVIRNERQDKDFTVYHSLLSRSFQDMYHVLKPEAYLTVTFHNPTFKVRNATIYAGVFAGFEFQKIHHQELARPSAKSLLQPFGSAQGDFYLRFYKPQIGEGVVKPTAIDEVRFEKIVVETAIRVIAERGEPTPYTIIINTIVPELARLGYFSELQTGLDVKTVLRSHLDKEFILMSAQIGGAEGKLWWLKDPSMVPHLESVPLTERVEQTVLRRLQQRAKVTFTEIWDAVSSEFPNSLTSDSMSIIDALKAYARQVSGGYWLIKPDFRPNEIEKEHTTIIAILAEIGKPHGFKIWVGNIEQSHEITALPGKSGELKQYLSFNNIKGLTNIQNPDTVEDIDLIWIKDKSIVALFEVESTT